MNSTLETTSGDAFWYSKVAPPARIPELYGPPHHDLDTALLRSRHQTLQRVSVIEKSVATRKKKSVRFELLQAQQKFTWLGPVDA
jgi:hypothetical protein